MKFEKSINKNQLPFDFYLPDLNICIEYDGEQHFKNIFGMKSLNLTKENDSIKDIFCEKHNINLVRIPFYVESIEKELIKCVF